MFIESEGDSAICKVEPTNNNSILISLWTPNQSQIPVYRNLVVKNFEEQGLDKVKIVFPDVSPILQLTATPESAEDAIRFVFDIIAYEFKNITVIVGTEVKWVNKHSEPHTVTGESSVDLLDSPRLSQGASYSFKFDKPGKYQFICKFHDDMKATVTVVDQN